ncbi:hypothetical protein [Streptomyces sp. NPDC058964]
MPFPVELLRYFDRAAQKLDAGLGAPAVPAPAPEAEATEQPGTRRGR